MADSLSLNVGGLWPLCNAAPDLKLALRLLQGAQRANRPLALAGAARIALQPGPRPTPDIACEEIAALEAVLRVSAGDRRHCSARAGIGVRPWLACVHPGSGHDPRGGRLGVDKVDFQGHGTARGKARWRRTGYGQGHQLRLFIVP